MKIRLLVLCCISIMLSFTMQAGVITLDGTYQGDNLYVQNPFNSGTNTFCITEVLVNDKPLPESDISTSAFEVPLNDFAIGDYVHIQIKHKDDCKPRVLNKEVLLTKSTFEVVSMKVDENSLKWTTKNENSHQPFIVEQFKNNKWVRIATVIGKGPEGYNNYTIDVNHHSGSNKYRIKQEDLGGKFRYSDPVEYVSDKPPISFYPKRADKELFLSEEAEYEIYDSYGSLVKKGKAPQIDISEFESGIYYLNIDNRTERFLKK